MYETLTNTAKALAIATCLGVVGCASTAEEDSTLMDEIRKATDAANNAAASAEEAKAQAADASSAANAAKMSSDEAKSLAMEAKAQSDETDAKLERMFQKAMSK